MALAVSVSVHFERLSNQKSVKVDDNATRLRQLQLLADSASELDAERTQLANRLAAFDKINGQRDRLPPFMRELEHLFDVDGGLVEFGSKRIIFQGLFIEGKFVTVSGQAFENKDISDTIRAMERNPRIKEVALKFSRFARNESGPTMYPFDIDFLLP